MSNRLPDNRCARLLAVAVALSASMASPVGVPRAFAAEERKDSAGVVEKMKQWQDKMSDKFSETWKGWLGKKDDQSMGAASVDLREQKDSYTLRLNLPDRDLDKVEIELEGDSLRIVAPGDGKASRYEQVVTLADVAPDAKPQIERKQKANLIVVTVPKARSAAAATPSPPSEPATTSPRWEEWERDVFGRMEKMRREMDRIFEDSFKEFRVAPGYQGLFDRPRFGSSLDLQEEGDNYVVRAYLPDRNVENVKATVEGETLKIEVKAEEAEKKEDKGVVRSHKAQYTQLVTLPGPVKAEKMKVEKKEGMIIVTLPKA